ncbi:Gfo/Idh/MocA family protein [Verminephrobacter eiseniae]|uniref:4,5-dihydroxyphthalate dehydrogenase n=1 Tax=Verminephrobacter eiseniae (strain EF01-2) TaxID=391735 RepID=A1WM03_VEREI|nr:4,5-dihydroxyphthalate dehydrogenase [Verminephrobacter eiseniae EF01-2]
MSTAQRPIRLGVAGLGRAFTLMLPTLVQDSRVQLLAACDPRAAARAQFLRDFGAPAYPDIEGLAADPSVDAIYIASPHALHARHTCIAARHGKHVLVEKPMALTLAECDAMITACRAAGVQLIVGHCHSFDAPYAKARAIIAGGGVGPVRMIHALNYTDFLYRPRRPEELQTEAGGGVVFSQAAHQIDIVRLLAASAVTRVRAVTGAWDAQRPTEGAYSMLLWFETGAFASLGYSGYGHFDSDEWCDWTGEMGARKAQQDYGRARQRLARLHGRSDGAAEEARLKAASSYGGPDYRPAPAAAAAAHQHFGPVIVSCDLADLRPVPDGVWVYGDERRALVRLPAPAIPRHEVITELYAAIAQGVRPLHDGPWARATLEVCLALLQSAREDRDVTLARTSAGRAGR